MKETNSITEKADSIVERKTSIKSRAGYDIPVRFKLFGDEKIVVVMAHGFGSSKASPTVTLLMDNLPQKQIGVVAFDFPGHGESPVDGASLRIENCVNDIEAAVAFAKTIVPDAEIINFGSSFGAYNTLLYITKQNETNGTKDATNSKDTCGKLKAFLRSAAVNMPELFTSPTPEEAEQLARDGYVILDFESRNLKITNEFIADLQANNLFQCFKKGDAEIKMIHGTADQEIDYAKAKEFATQYNIELITVINGDHQLSIPGAPEKVVEETLKFIVACK